MAISKSDQERIDLENKAVKEATREYDDLVATLILRKNFLSSTRGVKG